MIRFTTNLGSFDLELDAKAAPKTVANFERYVKEGFYNGTLFHRVIDGFMIQGGGFEAGMQHKEGHAPIENEAMNGLKNDKYTIAMTPTPRRASSSSTFPTTTFSTTRFRPVRAGATPFSVMWWRVLTSLTASPR